jgi:hypothetical protein
MVKGHEASKGTGVGRGVTRGWCLRRETPKVEKSVKEKVVEEYQGRGGPFCSGSRPGWSMQDESRATGEAAWRYGESH